MNSHKIIVLLVEDDRNLREVVSMVLADEGYIVLQADNGQTALDLLNTLPVHEKPHCVVLDLQMPVMGGNEFLDVIEKTYQEKFGDIPVIICSAEGQLKEHHQVVARLDKPVGLDILCRTINQFSENLRT